MFSSFSVSFWVVFYLPGVSGSRRTGIPATLCPRLLFDASNASLCSTVVPQPVYMNASELRQQQQQLQQQQQNGADDQQLIYTTSLVSCTIYDDGQGDCSH